MSCSWSKPRQCRIELPGYRSIYGRVPSHGIKGRSLSKLSQESGAHDKGGTCWTLTTVFFSAIRAAVGRQEAKALVNEGLTVSRRFSDSFGNPSGITSEGRAVFAVLDTFGVLLIKSGTDGADKRNAFVGVRGETIARDSGGAQSTLTRQRLKPRPLDEVCPASCVARSVRALCSRRS